MALFLTIFAIFIVFLVLVGFGISYLFDFLSIREKKSNIRRHYRELVRAGRLNDYELEQYVKNKKQFLNDRRQSIVTRADKQEIDKEEKALNSLIKEIEKGEM
ncbi:membrane protein [Staphylococcus phage CF7]|nr:membrane protein [Staphylococcus phage CF7]